MEKTSPPSQEGAAGLLKAWGASGSLSVAIDYYKRSYLSKLLGPMGIAKSLASFILRKRKSVFNDHAEWQSVQVNSTGEIFRNSTYTSKWFEESSYSGGWGERSQMLLDMFVSRELREGLVYRAMEFGCGPYAPFQRACKDIPSIDVQRCDIKQWDEGVLEIDLNSMPRALPEADLYVLSGVLEYLDDLPGFLRFAATRCKYMLLSYAFMPSALVSNDEKYLEKVRQRVFRGWRSHLTNVEIVGILSEAGIISNVGAWGPNHSLFLLRSASLERCID